MKPPTASHHSIPFRSPRVLTSYKLEEKAKRQSRFSSIIRKLRQILYELMTNGIILGSKKPM